MNLVELYKQTPVARHPEVFATVCECLGGFQFIKIALSADQTANITFRVCGVRS